MNIKEAKQEISNTLRAYHEKDPQGNYCYPLVRQRPILLMGPPGIGKTAIMEQVARENQVGLVSYTITHHTRQSAIGLPRVRDKIYDGRQISVTEYTMSEIIDSVYACMERTGKREGILFIDEINCASETLAPTMLQFLQNKTFGSHRVPEGWMIVAAGNPPEYNKSVREFDIVTLDRVRRIDVEVDCDVWREYAWRHNIHGAVLSYLNLKKNKFYEVENTAEGKSFVTARGWEDLSELIKSYERLEIPVKEAQIIQFLQKEETARNFAAYYQLYRKYGQDYGITEILQGTAGEELRGRKIQLAAQGSFEERFTVTALILEALNQEFEEIRREEQRTRMLHQTLQHYKKYQPELSLPEALESFVEEQNNSLKVKWEAELLTAEEAGVGKWVTEKLEEYLLELKKEHVTGREEGFEKIREWFAERIRVRKNRLEEQKARLERGFVFLEEAFGDGQEIVLFVTELSRNEKAMEFISANGCDPYFGWSGKLLYRSRREELLQSCQELLGESEGQKDSREDDRNQREKESEDARLFPKPKCDTIWVRESKE